MVRLYPSLYGVDGFVPTCREAGRRIDRGDGFPAIPASLPEQPFFYPVTNEEYATQIGPDGNTKDEASTHLLCQGASSLPKTPSSLADSKYLQQTGESAFAESSNPSSSNTRSSDTVLAHLGVNQPTVQRHDMLFDSPAEVQDKKKRQAGYSRYWTS